MLLSTRAVPLIPLTLPRGRTSSAQGLPSAWWCCPLEASEAHSMQLLWGHVCSLASLRSIGLCWYQLPSASSQPAYTQEGNLPCCRADFAQVKTLSNPQGLEDSRTCFQLLLSEQHCFWGLCRLPCCRSLGQGQRGSHGEEELLLLLVMGNLRN